MDYLVVC